MIGVIIILRRDRLGESRRGFEQREDIYIWKLLSDQASTKLNQFSKQCTNTAIIDSPRHATVQMKALPSSTPAAPSVYSDYKIAANRTLF